MTQDQRRRNQDDGGERRTAAERRSAVFRRSPFIPGVSNVYTISVPVVVRKYVCAIAPSFVRMNEIRG